jgi:50S ribosomal protein L21
MMESCLPDDGRFAETGRGRLKIVYKKDRLRKYRLKKNTPRSLGFAA